MVPAVYTPSRGRQLEPAVVEPAGRLPATAVADPDRGPLGERGERCLHLGPAREVRGAVHEAPAGSPGARHPRGSGCSSRTARRRASRSGTGRTAWSTTAGAGRTASAGTSRPGPRRPRGRRGRRRAGAARRRPGDRPGRCRRRRPDSRPAGTAARSAPPSVRVPEAASRRLEHPVHHPRVGDEERLDGRPAEDDAAQRREGHDVGDRRLAEEDRDLAEELAPAEPGPLLAVDLDRAGAVEDDVEARAGEPLAEDPLALREPALLEGVGDRPAAPAWSGPRRARTLRSRRRSRRSRPSVLLVLDGGPITVAPRMGLPFRVVFCHRIRHDVPRYPAARRATPPGRDARRPPSEPAEGDDEPDRPSSKIELLRTGDAVRRPGSGARSGRIAERAVEVDFADRPDDRPPGRGRDGLLPHRQRAGPGSSATARRSPSSARATSSASCPCSTASRGSRPSPRSRRRPAWPSPRGSFETLLESQPRLAIAILRGVARRLRAVTVGHRH